MQNRKQKGRPKYRLTVKLDLEWDAAVIAWLESLPAGERSHAVREVLREAAQSDQPTNLEAIREVVASELARALDGRQFSLPHVETIYQADEADIESEYGDRLDQMLGGLQSRETGDSEK